MPPEDETADTANAEATKDVAFGAALVALGIFLLVWIVTTPDGFGTSASPIGFDTVPIICSSALIGLSAIYLARRIATLVALRRSGRSSWPRLTAPGPVFWQRIATVAALVAYALALKALPFFVATLGLLALMFVVYGQRSPTRVALVAVLGSAALTGLFVYLLRLPL